MVEISVVMAVYNIESEHILRLAVNSILNQTFRDFEFIICDDGSTDGTYSMLIDMALNDSRIILLRNEKNLKSSIARNRCITQATGRFIAIMDADDYSAPDRLEQQRSFLLSSTNNYAFVGSKGQFFNKAVGDTEDFYWYCAYPENKDFLFTLPFVHASLMLRRDILQQVGGYRTSRFLVRSEDYDMLMNIYALGHKGANLDGILYHIRQDEMTYKRRKYRFRINESIVKWRGFYRLNLMPKGILYALKPLLVGLFPVNVLNTMKRRHLSKINVDKDNEE